MNKNSSSKALNSAYRLLAVKDRGEKELAGRLRAKGFGSRGITDAMERLKAEGLINDARFIKRWIADCMAFRPKGPLAIRSELIKKGLEKGLIDTIMGDDSTGYNERDLAASLAEKKIESLEDASNIRRKKAVYEYLARRGFSFDVINDIIDGL